MIETILPEMDNKMENYLPISAVKKIFNHMDNAPCQSLKVSMAKIS